MEMDGLDIRALSNLLSSAKKDDDDKDYSDDEAPTNYAAKLGPSSIGAASKPIKSNKLNENKKLDPKDIWQESEVTAGAEYECTDDTRPQPDYRIVYKQSVTTEDMFLQMGNKATGTASCEDMIVKISLPDTKGSDITLDVKDKYLDCRTPKCRLGLHLPHPVNGDSSKAQWVVDKQELHVTMRMNREYDFVNF